MIKVSAGLIVRNGKLLIARRRAAARLAGLWEFPGGKIEPGETPAACLKRELKEEFDIDAAVGEFLGANRHAYDFGAIELMLFRTTWEEGSFKLRDHDKIRWVSAGELDRYDFTPADTLFVEKLQSGDIRL